jgi:hypothetical protein
MSWNPLTNLLAEGRPRLAALLGVVTLGSAGVGAVVNSAQFMDMLGARNDHEIAAKVEAEARQEQAMKQIAADATALAQTEADVAAWKMAVSTNSVTAFDYYLRTYPNGRFKTEAAAAKAKLEAAAAAVASARAFDLRVLHPSIVNAVEAARKAAQDAASRQTDAERTAALAQAAAAQTGGKSKSLKLRGGDSYQGEADWKKPQGLGVYTAAAGDRFAGQFQAGVWSGLGVFESQRPGAQRPARYSGEVRDGKLSGSGVIVRADGVRLSGVVTDGVLNGPGVETRTDGKRFEGEFKNGAPEGFGVLWSANGRVLESGRYQGGALAQPLQTRGPAASASTPL